MKCKQCDTRVGVHPCEWGKYEPCDRLTICNKCCYWKCSNCNERFCKTCYQMMRETDSTHTYKSCQTCKKNYCYSCMKKQDFMCCSFHLLD